jgi:hypothetical protein
MLRAGFEPATRRLGGDNGNVAGPQQRSCRGRGVRSGADLNRSAAAEAAHAFQITEPLRPATGQKQTHQDSNPDLRGWSSPCFLYTTGLYKRTTRLERASPGWRPGALPTELHPQEARSAGLEPATTAIAKQCSVH